MKGEVKGKITRRVVLTSDGWWSLSGIIGQQVRVNRTQPVTRIKPPEGVDMDGGRGLCKNDPRRMSSCHVDWHAWRVVY